MEVDCDARTIAETYKVNTPDPHPHPHPNPTSNESSVASFTALVVLPVWPSVVADGTDGAVDPFFAVAVPE